MVEVDLHMHINRLVVVWKTGDLAAEVRPVSIGVTVLSALEVVVRRKSKTDLVSTDSITACSEDLEEESTSVLDRATIFVSSVVDVVVKELLKKIAIGT